MEINVMFVLKIFHQKLNSLSILISQAMRQQNDYLNFIINIFSSL
jgi:hypothetical protein